MSITIILLLLAALLALLAYRRRQSQAEEIRPKKPRQRDQNYASGSYDDVLKEVMDDIGSDASDSSMPDGRLSQLRATR